MKLITSYLLERNINIKTLKVKVNKTKSEHFIISAKLIFKKVVSKEIKIQHIARILQFRNHVQILLT